MVLRTSNSVTHSPNQRTSRKCVQISLRKNTTPQTQVLSMSFLIKFSHNFCALCIKYFEMYGSSEDHKLVRLNFYSINLSHRIFATFANFIALAHTTEAPRYDKAEQHERTTGRTGAKRLKGWLGASWGIVIVAYNRLTTLYNCNLLRWCYTTVWITGLTIEGTSRVYKYIMGNVLVAIGGLGKFSVNDFWCRYED